MRSVLDFIVILPDYFLVGCAPKWAAAPLDWNLTGNRRTRPRIWGGFLLTEWPRASPR
jgi:hypothetical protein